MQRIFLVKVESALGHARINAASSVRFASGPNREFWERSLLRIEALLLHAVTGR